MAVSLEKSFPLRMPPTLREALQREADERGHSLNAEINERLTRSLSAPVPAKDTEDLVRQLVANLPGVTKVTVRFDLAGKAAELNVCLKEEK